MTDPCKHPLVIFFLISYPPSYRIISLSCRQLQTSMYRSFSHPVFLNSLRIYDHHTVLNAFLISRSIARAYFVCESFIISLNIYIASSVDLFFLKPNWESSSCGSINLFSFIATSDSRILPKTERRHIGLQDLLLVRSLSLL